MFRSMLVILVGMLALPAIVTAQEVDPVDPESGTPSGAIYSIPLDDARQDASPAGGGQERAPVHSNNGAGSSFGSSTLVPGATPTAAPSQEAAATGPAPDEDRPARRKQGTRESDRRDGLGLGRGAEDPPQVAAAAIASGGGSDSPAVPLIVLGLALAVGGGLAALTARRRRG